MSFPRDAQEMEPRLSKYAADAEVARLSAKADAILDQLNTVVAQMSALLREGTP